MDDILNYMEVSKHEQSIIRGYLRGTMDFFVYAFKSGKKRDCDEKV